MASISVPAVAKTYMWYGRAIISSKMDLGGRGVKKDSGGEHDRRGFTGCPAEGQDASG